MNDRHENADTRPVTIERSDAIDAAAALLLMADKAERDARSRRYTGPDWATVRRSYRDQAATYRAAAGRVQAAADAAF